MVLIWNGGGLSEALPLVVSRGVSPQVPMGAAMVARLMVMQWDCLTSLLAQLLARHSLAVNRHLSEVHPLVVSRRGLPEVPMGTATSGHRIAAMLWDCLASLLVETCPAPGGTQGAARPTQIGSWGSSPSTALAFARCWSGRTN